MVGQSFLDDTVIGIVTCSCDACVIWMADWVVRSGISLLAQAKGAYSFFYKSPTECRMKERAVSTKDEKEAAEKRRQFLIDLSFRQQAEMMRDEPRSED